MRTYSYAWLLPVTYDKVNGHTIQFAIVENPMLHANFMVLCFIEPELLPMEVLHCGNIGIFDFFRVCDLDFNRMTFIYEFDPYFLLI